MSESRSVYAVKRYMIVLFFIWVSHLNTALLYASEDESPQLQRSRKEILGPINQIHVQSFAKSEYVFRSTKKAFFLSLALPGAGQLYVGRTRNYIAAAAFGAVEASLIGGWYYYSIVKYTRKKREAAQWANQNFSALRYDTETVTMYRSLVNQDEFEATYITPRRDTYCDALYGTDGYYSADGRYNNDCENIAADHSIHRAYIAQNSPADAGQLYGLIESDQFILGWSDAQKYDVSMIEQSGYTLPLGRSSLFQSYVSLREQAREYEDMKNYFFLGVLVNHIVSAVDAYWAAQINNDKLYNQETEWYQHIRLQSDIAILESGVNTDISLVLRF